MNRLKHQHVIYPIQTKFILIKNFLNIYFFEEL